MGRFAREHYERFWTHEIERLHHTGRNEMRGVCPVHGGDSPDTLVVHLDNGFAHCFKCHNDGESWSMVDFAMVRHGMNVDEAHRYVADITGVPTKTNGGAPWNFDFAKPLALTADDWQTSILAQRIIEQIEYFDQQPDKEGDAHPGWEARALYVYEDCRGVKVRFQHKKTGEKRMSWWALTDKGGWAVLRHTGRVAGVYRAQHVKGREEVWLANGEKACLRMVEAWKIEAVCSLPNGESWKDEYLKYFEGVHTVFLPPDNDAKGQKFAREAGAALMRAGIETRIVALPGLPEKGDAWDYIEQGGTYEAARTLALGSPLADPAYTPPVKKERPPAPEPSAEEAARAREGPDLITGYGFTDMDNAHRLMTVAAGDLAFSTRLEELWLIYNGVLWKNQSEHMVEAYAERTMRLLAAQAERKSREEKWAQRNLNAGGTHAMIKLARRLASVEIDDFDRQPWLINCPSGVYDAAKEEWREHRREDRLTRVFPYDYDPALPEPVLFLRSLFEWLGGTANAGDAEMERIDRLIAYVRRVLAYCLTGDISEKAFIVVHGEKGNNGKTTFLSVFMAVLGEYAITIHPGDLTRNAWKNQNNVQANIARSRGARALFAGEPPQGEKFDQSMIKMLTQGEVPVSAVFKGKQPFEFMPTGKILLECNKVPSFDTDDPAFMKRMHAFLFAREFAVERSNGLQLRERLRREQPAIFTWAVKAIPEYREIGLARPQEVTEDLKAIRDEQARDDGLEPFLEEFFDTDPRNWCRLSVIEELHRKYSERYKAKPMPRNVLSRRLTERIDITRGNAPNDHHTPAWLKGLAPKPGMATATVGAVLWGYDGASAAAKAVAAGGEEERQKKEAEDEYWRKWPRN